MTETNHDSLEPLVASSSFTTTESRFSCNICLDSVTEPVVTQCGHLYCWPCMYQWLAPGMLPQERHELGMTSSDSTGWINLGTGTTANAARRVCPVCKAPCSVTALVPIYVRNENDDQERHDDEHVEVEDADVSNETDESVLATPPRRNGLRRRMARTDTGAASSDSGEGNETRTTCESVPARPPASTPLRNQSESNQSSTHYQAQQHMFHPPHIQGSPNLSPSTVYLGSLTRGMAFMIQQQQASGNLLMSAPSPPPSSPTPERPAIPPLQRLMDQHGRFTNTLAPTGALNDAHRNMQQMDDPDATEVLSRLLLLLGSFVVLCLLLF